MTDRSKTSAKFKEERAAFQRSAVETLRSLADRIEKGDLYANVIELENEVNQFTGASFMHSALTGAQVLRIRFYPKTERRS